MSDDLRDRAPLPLVLVAAMLVVGTGLELALDGRLDAASKAPLAILLALAFARARRRSHRPHREKER